MKPTPTPVIEDILRYDGTVFGEVCLKRGGAFTPLGDVGVRVFGDDGQHPVSRYTRTNADGTYAVNFIRPGSYWVGIEEHGYGGAFVAFDVQEGDVRVDVELAAQTIGGRVVDRSGQALAGIEVEAYAAPDVPLPQTACTVITGADGAFQFPSLQRGLRYELSLRDRDRRFAPVSLEAEAGDRVPLVITLDRYQRLVGRVRHRETGDPVPGATVRMFPGEPFWGVEERTRTADADGRFAFDRVVPGTYRLVARHRALVALVTKIDVHHEDRTADVELSRGVALSGRIIDADGGWLPGALLADVTDRAPNHDDLDPDAEAAQLLAEIGVEDEIGYDVGVCHFEPFFGPEHVVRTSGDGSFSLPRTPPGLRRLLVHHDQVTKLVEIMVPVGRDATVFRVEIRLDADALVAPLSPPGFASHH